jgi:uncharacterized protein YigE (DUF2233 family)
MEPRRSRKHANVIKLRLMNDALRSAAAPTMARALVMAMLAASSMGARAGAVECRRVEMAGKHATACHVDVTRERLRLFLNGSDGRPLHTFVALERALAAEKLSLVMAMNAGMFHPSYAPVGLLVLNGKTISPLNRAAGEGNFFLAPNGVFFVTDQGAGVRETAEFAQSPAPSKGRLLWATQSGPLLVRAGVIHPQLSPRSSSRLIRNGVGVDAGGAVELVISDEPMSFYEFALLLRDRLHCPDALYLDGTISSLHAPSLGVSLQRAPLGPIVGVVAAGR